MDCGLRGRRAIVTGGTRGIGAAIARALASEGANISVCGRDLSQVELVRGELASLGVICHASATDIASGAALRQWVADSADALGGIDIVVANVSAMAVENSEEAWRLLFETDLLGAVRVFDAARPHLEAAGGINDASFTAISSISALETTRAMPYGAMKAALNHFVKGLAYEMAPMGVRANIVAPGQIFFKGGVWDRLKDARPDYYEAALKANPTGRMGTPEEVASLVAFLSGSASRFTTGATFVIDGAATRRVA